MVRQVDEGVVVAEHVAVAERGSAGQVEVANGQQHEPDEVVVPTLWQWLRNEEGFERGFPGKLLSLEDVARVPLLFDLLQLGETLAPVARRPITEKFSKVTYHKKCSKVDPKIC